MKKYLLLSLFAVPAHVAFNQVSVKSITNIDSAKRILQSAGEDTLTVKLLQGIFNYYNEHKLDSALYFTDKALSISLKLNYAWGIGRCYGNISHINIGLGNYNTALEYGLKCLRIFEKLDYPEELAICYNRLGRIVRDQNNLREALTYFHKAVEVDKQIPDPSFKALHFTNISGIYLRLNQPDSALNYSEEAYRLWRSAENRDYMSLSLSSIAESHTLFGNITLATEYLRMAIQQSIEINNLHATARHYWQLAGIFSRLSNQDSTLFYAKRSLDLFQQMNIKSGVDLVALLLAKTYQNKQLIDSAYKYQSLAISIREIQSSEDKISQIQNLSLEEKLRQQELDQARRKEAEERKHNIQYSAIALGLVVFVLLFLLLSHSIIANQKLIKFLGILALLIVFEFINLILHPYLGAVTHHSPVLMLLIMVCIAALLIPLHHRLEKWVTHRLVEKNKKIRLEAARKTIARLEGRDET